MMACRLFSWFTPLPPPMEEVLFSNVGKSLVQVLIFLWLVGLAAKPLQVGGGHPKGCSCLRSPCPSFCPRITSQ